MVRRSRWLFGGLFIGVIALSILGVLITADFLTTLADKGSPDRQLIYGVFGIAILIGGSLGFWIGHLAVVVANAFFGFRRDKLLIECWDALHQDTAREEKS